MFALANSYSLISGVAVLPFSRLLLAPPPCSSRTCHEAIILTRPNLPPRTPRRPGCLAGEECGSGAANRWWGSWGWWSSSRRVGWVRCLKKHEQGEERGDDGYMGAQTAAWLRARHNVRNIIYFGIQSLYITPPSRPPPRHPHHTPFTVNKQSSPVPYVTPVLDACLHTHDKQAPHLMMSP